MLLVHCPVRGDFDTLVSGSFWPFFVPNTVVVSFHVVHEAFIFVFHPSCLFYVDVRQSGPPVALADVLGSYIQIRDI